MEREGKGSRLLRCDLGRDEHTQAAEEEYHEHHSGLAKFCQLECCTKLRIRLVGQISVDCVFTFLNARGEAVRSLARRSRFTGRILVGTGSVN
ncbi:hypothetical protein R1flu_003206 [Riccia fluitans]|uniref:Uncharacterized protein n=1 Tax=Riccia fluitans TaxID=41844 RepID=A0ABD1Y8C1_9MARC